MYLLLRLVVRRPATSPLRSWAWSSCIGKRYNSVIRRVQTTYKPPQRTEYRPLAKTSKPLRILFCGSDDFSSASLRGLLEEQRRDPELIASIDVLCRPGKPSGRSLKNIREVPIKAVAQELGLVIHERDTFTGWDLPKPENEPINLIIAVSFGLFVPPRILRSAEYGGLNIHPSLLPDFQGPAPLQHTIISGAKCCGVTLQTLDEKSFDNGIILAQTPQPGLKIPFGNKCTYQNLLQFVTPLGTAMLVQGLRDRVFVPPLIDVRSARNAATKPKITANWPRNTDKKLVHASKITSEDRRINWRGQAAVTIERHYRALGRLWSEVQFDPETKRRVVFEDMEIVPMPEVLAKVLNQEKGTRTGILKMGEEKRDIVRFMVIPPKSDEKHRTMRFFVIDGDAIIIACRWNGALRVKEITVEGKGKQAASKVFQRLKEWEDWKIVREDFRIVVKKSSDEDEIAGVDEQVKIRNEKPAEGLDEGHHKRVGEGEKEGEE